MDITENTSKSNRLISGMESLSRLATNISAGTRETLHGLQNKPAANTDIDPRYLNPIVQIRIPSLEQVLGRLGVIPEYSILIGAAEDSSPILMDLSSSEAGSLLILGDPDSGKTRLMLSMLSSACLINSPRKFRFSCITFQLGDIAWLNKKPHAYQITAPYNEKAYQVIRELANLLEQRRNGRDSGPAVILAIDGLDELVPSLDAELLDLLLWMIENGPPYRIWTLATLDAHKGNLVQPEVIERFGTWLVGFMASTPIDGLFSTPRFEKRIQYPHRLLPGAQFGVLVEGEWVQFWVPSLN
ncbi:MAG: FtsK/SpoIIIE domain-containing protein [Anaerolineales bacterium]